MYLTAEYKVISMDEYGIHILDQDWKDFLEANPDLDMNNKNDRIFAYEYFSDINGSNLVDSITDTMSLLDIKEYADV